MGKISKQHNTYEVLKKIHISEEEDHTTNRVSSENETEL